MFQHDILFEVCLAALGGLMICVHVWMGNCGMQCDEYGVSFGTDKPLANHFK